MPRKLPRKTDQSVDWTVRALGVADAATLPRTRPFYRRIVELVERGMATRRDAAGARLPPERDLARALKISRTTVVSAYRELEAQRAGARLRRARHVRVGAARSRQRAVRVARQDVGGGAAVQRHDACATWCAHAGDPRLMSFAAGEPALDCFPTDGVSAARSIVVLSQRRRRRRGGTARPKGSGASARRSRERFGGAPDNILVIAGAQQGLDLLARCLIDPGDAVIIDRPGYLGAIAQLPQRRRAPGRLGHSPRADLDELEELLLRYRPKLIYTNPTHQNPTGVTLPIRARRELLELAERYRVPIVEDDTYRELTLGAPPPPSLYALDETHTIVIHLNSFSKMLAPGLRLGWIARGAADRRAAGADQAAGRSAHAEPVAARRRGADRATACSIAICTRSRRSTAAAATRWSRRCASTSRPAAALRGARRRAVSVVPARAGKVRARAVQQQAMRESVVFLTGEPFYVDRGGTQEIRVCFTSQPADRAEDGARALARAIATAAREPSSLATGA